jgi:pyruvate dehydrogenase E1 component beta subunit
VIFLEPTRLYRSQAEAFTDDGAPAALDVALTLRSGDDVTIVTYGAVVPDALAAAAALATEGVAAEVIDLQTLKPLDMPTVAASVERTGRCVIAHEAVRTVGVGAEVAARLAEGSLLHLLAPIERVTGYDTVTPLPRLERHFVPDAGRIAAAGRRAMEYR